MGNQQTKIGIRLDETTEPCETGGVLKGRVYLSLAQDNNSSNNNKSSSSCAWSGIHLAFTGEEYVQTASHHKEHFQHGISGGRHGGCNNDVVERATTSLVRTQVPLVDFTRNAMREGQYEYPFEFPIPADLPSSMKCKDRANYCEIRYKLTAHLVKQQQDSSTIVNSLQQKAHCTAETPVKLVARINMTSSIENRNDDAPLLMQPDSFPVNACCFWNKGSIELGWQADRAMVAPGETVTVQALGENKSRIPIQHLKAIWVETVSWKTGNDSHQRKSVTRTLAEQRIGVLYVDPWTTNKNHHYHHSLTQGIMNSHNNTDENDDDDDHRRVEFKLQLPVSARDSYMGTAVQVRHVLVVRACTEGGLTTTSPEISCQMRVHYRAKAPQQQQQQVATATRVNLPPRPVASVAASTLTTSDYGGGDTSINDDESSSSNIFVQAQVLPSDWHPIQSDVIVIPEAAAVVIDEDTTSTRSIAVPSSSNATSFLASAPREEDLLFGSTADVNAPTPQEAFVERQDTENTSDFGESNEAMQAQLRTMIVESPENVAVLLSDPSWTGAVQRLDPRAYCNLVGAAATTSPKTARQIARTLALTMGANNFTCRHVIACLWALPDHVRMPVVLAVAALPSDLDTHRKTIEQELRGNDLVQFRAALRDAGR